MGGEPANPDRMHIGGPQLHKVVTRCLQGGVYTIGVFAVLGLCNLSYQNINIGRWGLWPRAVGAYEPRMNDISYNPYSKGH